jgi:hypothetical protein
MAAPAVVAIAGEQRVEDHVALAGQLCWEPVPVLLFRRCLGAIRPTAIERLIRLCERVRGFAGDRQRGGVEPVPVPGCPEVSLPGRLSCRTGCR